MLPVHVVLFWHRDMVRRHAVHEGGRTEKIYHKESELGRRAMRGNRIRTGRYARARANAPALLECCVAFCSGATDVWQRYQVDECCGAGSSALQRR